MQMFKSADFMGLVEGKKFICSNKVYNNKIILGTVWAACCSLNE